MKTLTTSFLTLLIYLCASLAFGQSDPGDGSQSGLDVFFPGMAVTDAKKSGAKAIGTNEMQGKVVWGDKKWDVTLFLKGKDIAVVGLSAKLTGNDQVTTLLKDMGERLAVPMVITREVDGEKKELNFARLAVEGKGQDARAKALRDALGTYARQENGGMTVVFCPEDMLETLAKEMKAKGHLDGKAVMAAFGDAIVYTLHMEKKNDVITVLASTFADIKKF